VGPPIHRFVDATLHQCCDGFRIVRRPVNVDVNITSTTQRRLTASDAIGLTRKRDVIDDARWLRISQKRDSGFAN
jgi:hypothetical protein